MGRIFNTTTNVSTTPMPTKTGGRIFGSTDNPRVEPLQTPKTWEQMSIGERLWGTAKEIPKTLYYFIPPSIRETAEKPEATIPELTKASVKGMGEFGLGIAQVTAQATGGAILGAKQLITKQPEKVEIPVLGEVSSYQVQTNQLKEQGFSEEEAQALVGINAYLGLMPFAPKLLKTKPALAITKTLTTKEVPFTKTPEGIRQAIKTEAKPIPAEKDIIPQELQPLAQEARKYKSAEEFVQIMKAPSESEIRLINREIASVQKEISAIAEARTREARVIVERQGNPLTKEQTDNLFARFDKLERPFRDRIKRLEDSISDRGQKLLSEIRRNFKTQKGFDDALRQVGVREGISFESQLTDFYTQAVKGVKPAILGIPKELEPLAVEARKFKSAEEFVNIKRPPIIREIVDIGGNPVYHDTSLTGLKGILKSGEIKPSKVYFQKNPVVSVTRDFDNYSRYADSPYRLILDEKAIGHKGTPYLLGGERLGGEAETIFSKSIPGKSIKAIGLNTSHPQIASDLTSGKLNEIINLAKSKEIKIEFFDGKKLMTREVEQLKAKSQLTDFYTQAVKGVEKVLEPLGKRIISKIPKELEPLAQEAKSIVEMGGTKNRFGEFANVTFKEVPSSKIRNGQIDDYFLKEDGGIEILISKDLSDLEKQKTKIHALIEANYLKKNGISFEEVTRFDAKHKSSPQPGDRKDSPYFVEHQLANKAEKLFSKIKSQPTDFYNQATKKPLIGAKVQPELPEKPPVRVERPFVTGIKRIFGKTEEQQKFNQIMEEHLDKYFEGREQILGPEEPLNKALLKLSDKELENYSKFTQGFQLAENEITPALKSAVDLWKKVSKEEQDFLIKTKKLNPEQIENRRWKPVETITGRSREELKTMGVEPQYYPYLAEDLLKKSDFIATTGKRTKGGYLKRFTGKMLQEDSYIKNPKIAIPRHRVQVFRDKMNDELVNNIRDNFAEKDSAIIKQLKQNPKLADQLGLAEWKPKGGLRFFPITEEGIKKGVGVSKKVESYWIPETIADELNKFYRPGNLEKTLRMTYDPLIDMWRVSILNLVPRWLYNNIMGNTILYALGKGDPMALLFKAPKALLTKKEFPKGVLVKQYAGGELPKAGKLGGLPKEQTQFLRPIDNWLNLLEQAKNYKALRIPVMATQGLIKGWIALGRPIGFLNKVAENWFRSALYISKTEGKFMGLELDKPVPPAEGLKYVNEFLFDYSKLTRAERATFRRALPFYNWMKNIAEFSFKFPVNHPIRGLVVGSLLQDYVDYINEVNQKEDKVKSLLRIKTDMTYENKPLYLNIKSAIPFSDVFRTIPTNFETFGRFLTSNPVSKIIVERAFKINSFTGQPFSQPSEKEQFDEYGKPILPLPSLTEHLGQQFPQVKLGQSISDTLKYGKPLKRFETGEPKIYRGQIQTEDWLIPVLKYFGISLSATEFNKIKQQTERKGRLQEQKSRRYERQLETGLQRLKNQ